MLVYASNRRVSKKKTHTLIQRKRVRKKYENIHIGKYSINLAIHFHRKYSVKTVQNQIFANNLHERQNERIFSCSHIEKKL